VTQLLRRISRAAWRDPAGRFLARNTSSRSSGPSGTKNSLNRSSFSGSDIGFAELGIDQVGF
jgi:hypothetical protein